MKRLTGILIALLAPVIVPAQQLLPLVQPLIGTAPSTTIASIRHGSGTEQLAGTIPAVGVPFGMTQLTPQTQVSEQKCLAPYYYRDSHINGFRLSHWLSGSCTQDYGSVTLMPVTGRLVIDPAEYAVPFNHLDEKARPDYYRLELKPAHVIAELTALARSGMLKFTMATADSLYIVITPNSDKGKGFVEIDYQHNEIHGYNPAYRLYQGLGTPAGFSGYFVVRPSRRLLRGGVFGNGVLKPGNSIGDQQHIGAYIGFRLNKGEELTLRYGTSFTNIDEARRNLDAEIGRGSFTSARAQAAALWERALRRITINGATTAQQHIFYTAMYHTMQVPRLFSNVDGTYPMFSRQYQTGKLKSGQSYYDDFSMWDIYRAELPLYEIIDPKLINNLVGSVILKGRQGGWLPIFPCWNSYTNEMVGDHTTAFIASAWLKGIKSYNQNEAYRLMRQNAFSTAPDAAYQDGKGRRALNDYIRYGYIPLENPVKYAFHNNEQVSRTLEYAFDDYALAMIAKTMGRKADYETLIKRSENYRNVFDATTGFVRGRHADGSWITPFNPDERASFITEGTPRQYTFYVPQNVPGLAALMGGRDKLEAALDSLFAKGEYWHGNEPGHQIPFMYNYTASPWKTQRAVHNILSEEYADGPGGLCGNDDAGQISAWYIFGAMGFYPLNPVSGRYELCGSLFPHITINLPGGSKTEVVTHRQSKSSIYISSIKLNGKPYKGIAIAYAALASGCRLEVWLSDKPPVN